MSGPLDSAGVPHIQVQRSRGGCEAAREITADSRFTPPVKIKQYEERRIRQRDAVTEVLCLSLRSRYLLTPSRTI